MKIIITGGTGMIGRALLTELGRTRGHELYALTRSPEKATDLPAGARAVRWDGQSATGWGELADGADVIVNLAGESIAPLPWTGARKEKIRASRVNAGRAVVEAVRAARVKPRVVVQTSGIHYYGTNGSDAAVVEGAPHGSGYLADVTQVWEDTTRAVEELGVRRAVYRTGLVLSNAGGVLPLMSLPFRFFVGGPVGSGKQWLSWIHIADEVAGIRFLIENEAARGVFNFTAPNPVTNADFGRALGRALGRPAVVPAPGFAMKLALGEMAEELLLHGRRVLPAHLQELGFRFRFETIDAAFQDLFGKRDR